MAPSEEAAFWSALAAAPGDDTARLAFADWLEEHGDPRARWMRDADLSRYMRPGASDPLPALLEALDDANYEVWHPAVELFGRVGAAAMPALLARARSEDYDMWSRAGRALAGMDADVLRPALPQLIALLETGAASDVCDALEKLGPDAAPALPALLATEEYEGPVSRRSFASVMRAIGPAAEPAVPRLVTTMCWDSDACETAAEALVAIGLHTLDAALDGLAHVDHDYFYRGAGAIERFGLAAIPRLTEVLDEPPGPRRTGAVLALARLAPDVAVPHLVGLLDTEGSAHILELILNRIRDLGLAAASAAPKLREMLRQDAGSVYEDPVAEALATVTGDSGIPDLVTQLGDPDPAFRRRTLLALSKLAGDHPDARSALFRGVADADPTVRLETIQVMWYLLRHGDEDCVEPLRPCLTDPDPQIRAAAAGALGRIKSAAAPLVPELIAAMRDPDEDVRVAATETVDGMQYETPEMLAALLAALDDPNRRVRTAAAHGLHEWGHMYAEHTAAVYTRLRDPDPDVAHAAARLLCKSTDPTPEVLAFLKDTLRSSGDLELRASAATAFGKLKVADAEVITDLFALADATGRWEPLRALAGLGPEAVAGLTARLQTRPDLRRGIIHGLLWQPAESGATRQALPGLLASLADADGSTRADAARAIGEIGPAAVDALPRLRELLADPEENARVAAMVAVAQVCQNSAEALPDVLKLIGDAASDPRRYALGALAALKVPPAVKLPHVLAALGDEDVAQAAAVAAGVIGPAAAETVPLLVPLLEHEDGWVRRDAARALGRIGGPVAVPQLRAALVDSEDMVRREAATALGKIGTPAGDAVPDLVRLVSGDPDDGVRRAAAEALGELGATPQAAEAVAGLVEMLWSDNGDARSNAAQALGAFGPAARPAVPELVRALRDPAWGDIRKETWKRHTFHGIALVPMEVTDALAAIDQRIHVTTALRRIGPPEDVIPALAEAVSDANQLVANSAAEELRELLPASEPALRALLAHTSEDARGWAEWALAPPEADEADA